MDIEKLGKANELAGRISKMQKRNAALGEGNINLVLIPHKSTTPLMTIGTSDSCEHPLAALAWEALDKIRQACELELQALVNEFEKL